MAWAMEKKSAPADLNCCKTGWKVCSVGSRFCKSAEANYSPTDGEFTGLVDTLDKTAYFTLGCKSLTVGPTTNLSFPSSMLWTWSW